MRRSFPRGLALAGALWLLAGSAHAQIKLYGSLFNLWDVVPGETYSGTFYLANETDEPQQARLSTTDLQLQLGNIEYAEAGTLERSCAPWLTYAPDFVTLGPRERATVTLTLTIPPDQALRGTYWTGIVVDVIPRGSAESTLPTDQAENDRLVRATIVHRVRYIMQVAANFPGTGVTNIDVLRAEVVDGVTDEGVPTRFLETDMTNTGDHSYRPTVEVELYDEQGTLVQKLEGIQRILHPGGSARFQFDVGTVPAGTYRGLLLIDTGEDVFGSPLNVVL